MSSSVEILGQWVTLPDPDSVASLSNRYYSVCTTLVEAKSQLSAIGSPQAAAQWTGAAADTFATRLGSVPGQLEQAWQSCNIVARVLAGYSSNLRPVVAALRSLANQAEEAQGTLHATQAARDQALHAGEVSTIGVWNARLEEAGEAISQVTKRRSSLLAELHQLSAGCARQIRQADPEGVHQDLFSDLKRYAVDAGRLYWRVEKDEFQVEFTVAKDLFYQPFADLVDHIQHGQWDWGKVSKVLEDISGVLGILAIVCAPVPGLDAVLALGAIGFGLAGTAAEGVALATHEQDASWTELAFDVGGLALMGSGRIIGQGLKMARLADGPEAEVSAKSIWQNGTRHFINLKDPDPGAPVIMRKPMTVHDPIDTYKANLDSYVHLGEEPGASASQRPFEHAEWGTDRAENALDVAHTEYDNHHKDGS
jgi:hypothetical protein